MSEFGFLGLGYNKDGFNRNGYDRQGYNREGYDKFGFDRTGYNKEGYDKFGYDRNGWDKQGFDSAGYDKSGFNRQGYDREGYDRTGYNRQGYDREGFDKKGYDRQGYDRQGYNREGFDRNGFNKSGYDSQGYDKEGYDRNGYNRRGYNRQGYDSYGFDREGFDREGYNRLGYDRQGYDRNGFSPRGLNKKGINIWGYDTDWRDEAGYDVYGYDREGFDREGYDKNGFDRNGFDALGRSKEEFDSEGFHKKTGFNRFGFNRRGYNINGVNEKGEMDPALKPEEDDDTVSQSPNMQFLKSGVSLLQVGDTVYHKNLGAATIIKKDGRYCTVTFKKTNETMVFSLETDWLSATPSQKTMEMEASFDAEEDKYERKNLEDTISHIKTHYSAILEQKVQRKWTEKETDDKGIVIDNSGFLSTYKPDYSDRAESDYDIQLFKLLDSPYFARVKKGQSDFYIGKEGTDTIVDFRDPQCKYYYQYQIYIGIQSEKLKLVRDLEIKKGKLFGYTDKYNSSAPDYDFNKCADEHLKKIITYNRNNKSVHDIITSIQTNQYNIMVEDSAKNLLILGCAGSGKTMIMLHRISYLLYNDNSLKPANIFVLSPTKYLSFENSVLSDMLHLGNINKLTIANMYRNIIAEYEKKYNLGYILADEIKINYLQGNQLGNGLYYSQEYLSNITQRTKDIISKGTEEYQSFVNNYKKSLDKAKKEYLSCFESEAEFLALKEQVASFVHDCKNIKTSRSDNGYFIEDIKGFLHKCEVNYRSLEELYKIKVLIEFFLQNDCFVGNGKFINTYNVSDVDNILSLCKREFSFLSFILPHIELIEQELCSSYQNKTEAIQNILKPLFVHNIIKQRETFIALYDGLRSLSTDNVQDIISIINKCFEDNSDIEFKIAILKDLQQKPRLFATNNNRNKVYETDYLESRFFKSVKPIYDKFEFDIDSMSIAEKFKVHKSVTSAFEFFSAYQNIVDKEDELSNFIKAGQKTIIPKIIGFGIGTLDPQEKYIVKEDYEAFVQCYICHNLFDSLSNNKYLICIDEFQDLAPTEIQLIRNIYPLATFNYYGDFKQSISIKGTITEENIKRICYPIKEYQINENYRNAMQIAEYINRLLNIKMTPVGINGRVHTISYFDYSKYGFESGDRIAYIVKDKDHLNYKFMSSIGALDGLDNNTSEKFPANIPVAMTVQEVKGLEFEIVIVDFSDMTDNEKYVATTRALTSLYVINNSGKH